MVLYYYNRSGNSNQPIWKTCTVLSLTHVMVLEIPVRRLQ